MKAKTESQLKRQRKGPKPQPDMIMLHGVPYYQLHLTDPKQPTTYSRFLTDEWTAGCAWCCQPVQAGEGEGPLCWFCDLESSDNLAASYKQKLPLQMGR